MRVVLACCFMAALLLVALLAGPICIPQLGRRPLLTSMGFDFGHDRGHHAGTPVCRLGHRRFYHNRGYLQVVRQPGYAARSNNW